VVKSDSGISGYDIVVGGVPWEGTITWGSFTGCELAPRTIRHAAARYGGFLPEYDIDIFDHLKIADIGDLVVNPNDPRDTMENVPDKPTPVRARRDSCVSGVTTPLPRSRQGVGRQREGSIGVVHFDSHLDNAKSFGDDEYPRCGPLHRIAQIGKVRNESIVHLGIRGPRNSPAQMAYARSMGASVFTIRDIQKMGMDAVMEEAIGIARKGTSCIYVTICSDCIDAAFNPGGPADFNGLFPGDLFSALYKLGESGIAGLDFVEIYPLQDRTTFLPTWRHGRSSMLPADCGPEEERVIGRPP
jgi:agmatinase